MQGPIMAFAAAVKREFAGAMARETASREHSANCLIKPMGGQRIRLKPDSVPTKFIFTVEKPKRKEPADRATLNTKKTKIEKSQQHSAPEPINIENTDFKSRVPCDFQFLDMTMSKQTESFAADILEIFVGFIVFSFSFNKVRHDILNIK
ncbi:unnamed protein product [Pocillopora meandrina]|uniref:Uncharacterized protein n=1 Tax=Pocillopora meandrina TaxID=46732 RepID=A0AAU9X836_9CNID|nr:unnamed protein product [Pocillopora meandrina]